MVLAIMTLRYNVNDHMVLSWHISTKFTHMGVHKFYELFITNLISELCTVGGLLYSFLLDPSRNRKMSILENINVSLIVKPNKRVSVSMNMSINVNMSWNLKPSIHERAAYMLHRVFGVWLINFPRIWGEQRTPGAWKGHPAHPVLFAFIQKTDKFRFAANGMWTVCGHTYAHLVREPFGALVYTRLKPDWEYACEYECMWT